MPHTYRPRRPVCSCLSIAALLTAPAILTSPLHAQSAPPPSMNSMPLTVGGSSNARLETEDAPRGETITAPVEKTWPALKQAFADFKIPVTTLVDADHRIGFRGQRVRGKLAGDAVKRLVDCGQDQAGRDRADSYEVTLDFESVAAPFGDNTAVYSLIMGTARPVTTSGDPVRCVSTGRLEERVAAATRANARRP